MDAFMEWFRMDDFFPIVAIALILTLVGQQIGAGYVGIDRKAAVFAGAIFVMFTGAGIAKWEPSAPEEYLLVLMRALLALAVAYGIGMMTFPACFFIRDYIEFLRLKRKHDSYERPVKEPEPEPVPEPEPIREPAPPLPTCDELAAQALKRFEEKIALIDASKLDDIAAKAAREHAQQQYTRELDKVMQ